MVELTIGGIYRLYYIITCKLFSKMSVICGKRGAFGNGKKLCFLKNMGLRQMSAKRGLFCQHGEH